MQPSRLLIVCPDPSGLTLLTSMLQSLGHTIEEASSDRLAARMMERFAVNLVLASVDPGDEDSLELLNYVRRKHPMVPVLLMFPRIHPERAKEALRLGAMAVLKYPVPAAELRAAVLQALQKRDERPASNHLESASSPAGLHEARRLPATTNEGPLQTSGRGGATMLEGLDGPLPVGGWPAPERPRTRESRPGLNLIGSDPGLRQIIEMARALAPSQAIVLLAGEPGTGKTEIAQFLHRGSPRADRPFVVLAATDLIEPAIAADDASADSDRSFEREWAAKLAEAAGGTLYIKDVDQLGPELQLQLLRELQLQDMEAAAAGHPGGYQRPFARLTLSTSANLALAVEQGRFRQELYHRISSIRLMAPPLRQRDADIELLAEHFRTRYAHQFGRQVIGFTRDALDALQRHEWPGNVRELQGVIQRAVTLCNNSRISSSHLAPILNHARSTRGGLANSHRPHLSMGIRPLKEALEEPEKQIIIQALQALNWNRQETARMLDINRTTLYKKMKKYGLLVDEPIWVE